LIGLLSPPQLSLPLFGWSIGQRRLPEQRALREKAQERLAAAQKRAAALEVTPFRKRNPPPPSPLPALRRNTALALFLTHQMGCSRVAPAPWICSSTAQAARGHNPLPELEQEVQENTLLANGTLARVSLRDAARALPQEMEHTERTTSVGLRRRSATHAKSHFTGDPSLSGHNVEHSITGFCS